MTFKSDLYGFIRKNLLHERQHCNCRRRTRIETCFGGEEVPKGIGQRTESAMRCNNDSKHARLKQNQSKKLHR